MPNDNGKVNTGCSNTAKYNGGYFRTIKWTNGQVKPEANTKDQLSDQKLRIGFGKDFSKDTASGEYETGQQRKPSPKAISQPTAEESTKELSDGRTAVEGGLPTCRESWLPVKDIT